MDKKITHYDIIDFLKKDGAMGIIVMIDKESGTIHTDLKNYLHISRATATDRLEQARELELVETTRHPDDHGNAKRYSLTQMGRVIRVALESMGVDEEYQQYIDLRRELEQSNEDIIDWIDDTNHIWNQRFSKPEFELTEDLQQEDIYPGEDIPEGYLRYIEDETTYLEDVRREIENIEDIGGVKEDNTDKDEPRE